MIRLKISRKIKVSVIVHDQSSTIRLFTASLQQCLGEVACSGFNFKSVVFGFPDWSKINKWMNLKKQTQRHPLPTKKPNRQIILKLKKKWKSTLIQLSSPIWSKEMIDSIANWLKHSCTCKYCWKQYLVISYVRCCDKL